MLERYINILIVNDNLSESNLICSLLEHQSHNIHFASSGYQALNMLKEKDFGIVIVAIEMERMDGFEFLKAIKSKTAFSNTFFLTTCEEEDHEEKMVNSLSLGAVDVIIKPFNESVIKTKINVFKKLYFKQQRIIQLLRNVLPDTILEEFSKYGKSTPKRFENGIVMFTDFVNFSAKSATTAPIQLIKKLDTYFTKFDQIIGKYDLEKIKTIGDAYMVVGGLKKEVTTTDYVAMALASLEMRDFVLNEEITAAAFGEDTWKMRMGIHTGPLVGGVIGRRKFSYDVWGDTVNIASRAEEQCEPGKLYATKEFAEQVKSFFEISPQGEIEIRKRGGHYHLFEIQSLRLEHSLFNKGVIPSKELRNELELPDVDFEHAKTAILNKLKAGLDDTLIYHSMQHTLDTEKAAMRLCKLEGVSDKDQILVRTAVLFHDSGFLVQYNHNEEFGVLLMKSMLPDFGYTEEQIAIIENIILATRANSIPQTELEKIMRDADHDYLGRPDYLTIASRLRKELQMHGNSFTDEKWTQFQLEYLSKKHNYYTTTAKSMRSKGKVLRIIELENQLKSLSEQVKS
jgi:class 3 adenylate cyclase/HD superfamily phosphodiesterase/ActR/RegA family two-component response regulator